MQSEEDNTTDQAASQQVKEWRAERSEFCLTEDCENPVDLADGRYCSRHSVAVRKVAPSPPPTQRLPRNGRRYEEPEELPTSAMVAQRGINSASDFAQFMGALMADLVEGRIEPDIAKAACAAGDKLLQVVKMQMEYGIEDSAGNRTLRLTGGK